MGEGIGSAGMATGVGEGARARRDPMHVLWLCNAAARVSAILGFNKRVCPLGRW